MKKLLSLLAGVVMLAGLTVSAGTVGVDWGGSYGNSFSSTLNQGLGTVTTPIGDYTFDTVSDRAYLIPFGTGYTPSADSRYLAPAGKTGPLYTVMMLVNHSSATAPTNSGLYRWSAATNPNQLQKTNPTLTGGYTTMSMSASYFAKKADFLNGLNSATGISFSNATDAASVSMSILRNKNNGTATIAFIVQEGTDWYATIATNRAQNSADYAGTLTVNPYTANWYAFNPSANQFLNTGALGTAKAGSTFTNIMAFGISGQTMGYDGIVANSQKLDFSGFSGSFTAVPEPATIGMLGLGAVCVIFIRRRTRS